MLINLCELVHLMQLSHLLFRVAGSRFLVSGSDDGRLDLWEFAEVQEAALANLHSIIAHDDIVSDVAASPAPASTSIASSSRECRHALAIKWGLHCVLSLTKTGVYPCCVPWCQVCLYLCLWSFLKRRCASHAHTGLHRSRHSVHIQCMEPAGVITARPRPAMGCSLLAAQEPPEHMCLVCGSVRTWACTAADIQYVDQLSGHRQAVHCVAWGAEPSTLLSGSQAGLNSTLQPVNVMVSL